MRTTLLALAIAISGMTGNLQAAHGHRPAVHKVKRGKSASVTGNLQAAHGHRPAVHKVKPGESAARIARDNGLSVDQLASLNPKVNLGRLTVGTSLRVVSSGRAAAPPLRNLDPDLLAGRRLAPAKPDPDSPVTPLPGTPDLGPASLVHLERILPIEGLTPAPDGAATPDRSSAAPGSAAPGIAPPIRSATPSLAGLRKVLPEDDQPDDLVTVPPAAGSTEFLPADRDNLDLLWPVPTRTISSAWGPRIRTRVVRVQTSRRNRRVLRRFLGTHKGVDLSAPQGSDIYAALDGQVVLAGRHKQYGNFVALDHGNGVVTLYAHCVRNFVEEGQIVRRGQKIAEVGRTGNATGPHLHFELRLDGVPVNPLPKLNDTEEIPAELVAQNQTAVPPSESR
jgi:murein DD-endopeptidase MepM/ murein hydrolase activator NlpD